MLAQDVDRRYAAVREQIGREPSVAALVVYDPDLYVLLWRLCGGLSAYQRARGVAPQVPPIFGAIDSDYDALRDALHREPVRADFVGRHRRLAKLIEQYYGSLRRFQEARGMIVRGRPARALRPRRRRKI